MGKVCVITGASKGIGQGIALRFAAEGASVMINYRSDPEGAEATKAACEKLCRQGQTIVTMKADMGDVKQCANLIEKAYEQLGRVDVLVNNAGLEIHADFLEVTEADYDKVMDCNLMGPFFCTQAYVKKVRAEQDVVFDEEGGRENVMKNPAKYEKLRARLPIGNVVNVSSVHEDLPFPGFAAYCASKGGLKMLMRNLSIELAPCGININNIAPGAIETPINASVLKNPTKLAELMGKIPLARLGKPDDIASCAVYLASGESSYVTGSTIFVDGGQIKADGGHHGLFDDGSVRPAHRAHAGDGLR